MAGKLMYVSDDDTQNYPFCKLQLVVQTVEHSTKWSNQSKVPKVVKLTNKKTLL